MNLEDLLRSVEAAIGATRYGDESWFQFFERLNREGRLDLRACIFSTAVILDYLTEQQRGAQEPMKLPIMKPILPIDTRVDTPKKETTKPKKKTK